MMSDISPVFESVEMLRYWQDTSGPLILPNLNILKVFELDDNV